MTTPQDARTARLAAALRGNLRKRKEGERGVVSGELLSFSSVGCDSNTILKQDVDNTTRHSLLITHQL
ncbi:MAG: hypothetical protein ACK5O1_03495 [Holosporales bacterium]|jgi:hypothetical protein